MTKINIEKTETNNNEIKSTNIDNDSYWLLMYEELEEQMKQMMVMSLSLVEKETISLENEVQQLKNKMKKNEKDLKRYKQFEHSIRVTWIGKIAIFYVKVKRRIKKIIFGR